MVDYQTISIVFAGLSIGIAAIYYMLNIRHQRETRQAQLFNSIYQALNDKELFKIPWELELDWQYDSYDDFMEKYGPDTNREAFIRFNRLLTYYEGIGIYIKRGLIDAELIDDFISGDIVHIWEKYEPLITEWRARRSPTVYEHFEYLYDKVKPIRTRQHPEIA